jgi:hypothetical protein
MSKSNFWPLDTDSEGQIYDNVAWDLPGFRRTRRSVKKSPKQRPAPPTHSYPAQ